MFSIKRGDSVIESITVFVCTYNEEKYIKRCLSYIMKSISPNNIVVIDASDDQTPILASSLGVSVVRCEKGLEKQRQMAIDLCNTEYIVFVDADDCINEGCIEELVHYCKDGNYAAVGSKNRVLNPTTYWEKAIDSTWNYAMYETGTTKMVGRPCIYRTNVIKNVGVDTTFPGIGAEDTAILIRLERNEYKQGISNSINYRECPKTFMDNLKAWIRYGKGDADIIKRYPEKRRAIFYHNLIEYPVIRTWKLIKSRNGKYCLYTIGIGMTRLLTMILMSKRLVGKRR